MGRRTRPQGQRPTGFELLLQRLSHALLGSLDVSRTGYSKASGCRLAPWPSAAFFSQYFFTQASQLLPAAGSRPEKTSAEMSEEATFWRELPSFGKTRTKDDASVEPLMRSKM